MLSTLFKALLSLRYKVTIEGLEALDSAKGVLVLPNHPAEIDPVILSAYLWDTIRPRPIVLESFHSLRPIQPFMKVVRAIPMPDMGFDSGPFKRRRVAQAMQTIVKALEAGDSILIYPSGRLSVTGEERIGGNSGVHAILQEHPAVDIALVRIRGLYGSIFSKAATGGTTPDLISTVKRAATILAKNFLFFLPKREVTIEITLNPPDFPRQGDAAKINRYLERRFNFPEPEQPVLVSYSFRKTELLDLPELPSEADQLSQISPEIEQKVLQHLGSVAKVPPESLKPETSLGDTLGLDSLTIAELLLWIDREFEVTDVELSELTTVGSVMRAAAGQLSSGTPKPEFSVPAAWFAESAARLDPHVGAAITVPEAFLMATSRFGSEPAIGDDKSGVITWNQLKFKVLLLARRFASERGDTIGILLPASAAGSIASIAVLVAGKVPVFLNWTAGRRPIEHAIETSGLHTIITSRAFLDVVQADLEFLEGRCLFLEDIARQFTVFDFLAGKRLARESTEQLKIAFGLTTLTSKDRAAILFTSGSESLPKGVPLSHRNILTNIQGILEAFSLKKSDVLLGFLPPFHSFGLTVCTILPMITGLRVAYHPNPNESRKIARAVSRWGITLMAGTPTFLRSILKSGKADAFNTLRLMVAGAEKAPRELFELAASVAKNSYILEGYGITECSPVVAVNRPGEEPQGVGRALQGVEVMIVDPDTLNSRPDGEQGLILIRGASVFAGYLGGSPNPFVERREVTWYNSGDLGYVEEGRLVITGRLKRFIKIGGEMISLGAIEEALAPLVPSEDGVPSIALIARGTEGEARPSLVVYATAPLSVEQANETLGSAGFPHIARISETKMIKAIPLLGSGKVDYRSLSDM